MKSKMEVVQMRLHADLVMNRTWLLIVLLLSGCFDDTFQIGSKYPDVLIYCDSNGDPNWPTEGQKYTEQVGASFDCVAGRQLVNAEIPEGFGHYILNLGGNDRIQRVDIDQFRVKVQEIMRPNMVCILPYLENKQDPWEYREVLMQECTDYIDPIVIGVTIGADGVHYDKNGQDVMAEYLKTYLEGL